MNDANPLDIEHGQYRFGNEMERHPMAYSRGSNLYDPNSFGMDTYYSQNEIEDSLLTPQSMAKNVSSRASMESELREIKMLLSSDNYIVTEMTPDVFNTRRILYNRFRKWMGENGLIGGMFQKFNEHLHLQFCEEKKRDNEKPNAIRCTFIFCCPSCKENIKIVPKSKILKSGTDSNYYLLSNVVRHLRRVHLKGITTSTAHRRYRRSNFDA